MTVTKEHRNRCEAEVADMAKDWTEESVAEHLRMLGLRTKQPEQTFCRQVANAIQDSHSKRGQRWFMLDYTDDQIAQVIKRALSPLLGR